ncbi:MAG: tetratricopeptide repeat protein [Candidatus Omnitrophica bacterium]|nr:tetratricopeptide repeat protein [Candidatus Omnitrophota bacterium]
MSKAAILLIVIGLVVYANALQYGFVWDDDGLIVNNPHIQSWRFLPKLFTEHLMVSATKTGNFYRPIQALSNMIDYSIWKLNPFGYHLTNIIIHILNAFLMYVLVRPFYRNERIPILASLLFLVHPIQTEAVTYISGRADPLSCLFLLLMVLFYIKSKEKNQKLKDLYYWISFILYPLAILTKEMGVVFPLFLILHDLSFKKKREPWINKDSLLRYIPFLLTFFIYLALRVFFLKTVETPLHSNYGNLYLRLLLMAKTFFSYILIILFPVKLHMERFMTPPASIFDPATAGMATFFFVLIFAAIRSFKHSSRTFFFSMWFFIAFLPVSNIFPLNAMMAEHWMYIPSIGLFVLASSLLYRLSKRIPDKLFKTAIAGLILSLSLLTINQNVLWKDSVTAMSHFLKASPGSVKLRYNTAMILARASRWGDALKMIDKTLEIDPRDPLYYQQKGYLLYKLDRFDEAIVAYKKAFFLGADQEEIDEGLYSIYKIKGEEYDAEIEKCQANVKKDPKNALSYIGLGDAYKRKGLYKDAEAAYKTGLRYRKDLLIYNKLATLYAEMDNLKEELKIRKKIVKLAPEGPAAHFNLAYTLEESGRRDEAIAEYKRTLELDPQDALALNNLGLCHYKNGNYKEAKRLWKKALSINPQMSEALTNLSTLE